MRSGDPGAVSSQYMTSPCTCRRTRYSDCASRCVNDKLGMSVAAMASWPSFCCWNPCRAQQIRGHCLRLSSCFLPRVCTPMNVGSVATMDSDMNRQLAKPLMGSGAEAARRAFPPGSAAGLALGPAAGFREPRSEARIEGYAPLPQGNDRPPAPKVTALGVVEVCAWPPTSAPANAATHPPPDACRSVPDQCCLG
jgi:hypothetical protein